jgi:predicted metalloprotease with PDZ domain
MSTNIHYQVKLHDPHAHIFEVTCTVPVPNPKGQDFVLPAWIPGSYLIREFAKNIVSFKAENANGHVDSHKKDKDTYAVAASQGPLTVTLHYYAWDLSVRSAHFDGTHAFFNGTSLFLRPVGHESHPMTVDLQAREDAPYDSWRVATSLQKESVNANGFGGYRADDYDDLVDHPVEMGTFDKIEFDACGIPHDAVFSGKHDGDLERVQKDLKTICEYHLNFFGEPKPIDRYTFMTQLTADGYGGLEHKFSTALMAKRNDLPNKNEEKVSDGYRQFLGLCSHEYFHTWNVKRIKPRVFTPYNYNQESHTTLLWAFEGITSYYDDLSLARTGLITPQSYLELLGKGITRVLRSKGRKTQTLEESSFDTWTKFYRQDENAPNAITSYYTQGALAALGLDLTIRARTDHEQSLDDVMRGLWKHYGSKDIGVDEDGIERFTKVATGLSLESYFNQVLRTHEDFPIGELLQEVGVSFHIRPSEGPTDMGGKKGKKPLEEMQSKGLLGIRSKAQGSGIAITHAFKDEAAMLSGLSAGDLMIAIDGLKMSPNTLNKHLEHKRAGDTVEIHAFRRDELMRFNVTLTAPPMDTCYLTLDEKPNSQIERFRKDWLKMPS